MRDQETSLRQRRAEWLARTLLKLVQKQARYSEALHREAGYFQDDNRHRQYPAMIVARIGEDAHA